MEICVFTWVTAFLEQQQQQKRSDPRNHAKKLFHFSSEIRIHLINSYCWSILFIWINVRVHGEFFQSLASEFVRKKKVLALERTKLLSHKTVNGRIYWFSVFMSNSTFTSSISWDCLDYSFVGVCVCDTILRKVYLFNVRLTKPWTRLAQMGVLFHDIDLLAASFTSLFHRL